MYNSLILMGRKKRSGEKERNEKSSLNLDDEWQK